MMKMACGCMMALLTIGGPWLAQEIPQTGDGSVSNPYILFASETTCITWELEATAPAVAEVEFQLGSEAPKTIRVEWANPNPDFAWTRDGVNKVRIFSFASQLAPGVYQVRARIQSAAGIWSDWCTPIFAKKDWTKPEPPGGCIFRSA